MQHHCISEALFLVRSPAWKPDFVTGLGPSASSGTDSSPPDQLSLASLSVKEGLGTKGKEKVPGPEGDFTPIGPGLRAFGFPRSYRGRHLATPLDRYVGNGEAGCLYSRAAESTYSQKLVRIEIFKQHK
jgi:hypothetical protein